MERADRGMKAKSNTSYDNAFVTNNLALSLREHYAFAQKTSAASSGSLDAPGKLYSVRKRSGSYKASSRNGNQRHVMVMFLVYKKKGSAHF